jgi:hypothetical protein
VYIYSIYVASLHDFAEESGIVIFYMVPTPQSLTDNAARVSGGGRIVSRESKFSGTNKFFD